MGKIDKEKKSFSIKYINQFFSKRVIIIGLLSCGLLSMLYFLRTNEKNKYYFQVDLTEREDINSFLRKIGADDDLMFKLFLKLEKNSGRDIKAGIYEFNGSYSYRDIMNKIETGRQKYVALTIPEGFTVNDIGKEIEKRGLGSAEKFKSALKEVKGFPYPVKNGNYEGYLYPDTYHFSSGISEKEIAEMMLNQFLIVFPPEKHENKEKFYQNLILASIVEREAYLKEEKPIMASVFFNRMKRGMPLASDATVSYLYNNEKKKLYYKDLKIDSPYNTYMYKGLPPAPISNPSIDSYRAVENPAETKYLFFVVTEAGKHTFTRTYREHLKVQRSR